MGKNRFRVMFVVAAVGCVAMLPLAPPAAGENVALADLSPLVARLLPSCVNVTTIRYKEIDLVAGKPVMVQDPVSDKQRIFGSGFIISSDGLVVTNKHVVRNGIAFSVTFADGRRFPAELVEAAVAYDIAVLRIRSTEKWTPVVLGDSETVRRGDPVIAVGNPLDFQSSVTSGIISALNRDEGFTPFDHYMQTDAAINEGNSGGPLFDRSGAVIGVNSALYTPGANTGSVGIGYAIPINDVKFVVKVLLAKAAGQDWRPAWIGATVQGLTPDLASAYGLPGPWGSIVAAVDDAGPAAQAGIRVGDVILSIDGQERTDNRALMRSVVETPAGTTVGVGVWREGREENIRVKLADLPAGWSLPVFLGGGGIPKPDLPPEVNVNFGMAFSDITPELRARYQIDAGVRGVVVSAVAMGSVAATRFVDAGTVILRVRDIEVATPEDLLRAVARERAAKSSFVPMLMSVAGGLRWVPFGLN